MMFYDDAANYKDYLIDKFQSIAEIDAIAGSVNFEIDKLSDLIKTGVDNKFIATCDGTGAARLETILGVSTPLNSTLQARRDALKAKLMSKPPINLNALKAVIEAYMGIDVDITVSNYTITVKYRGESRIADLTPLYATSYDMIPANLLMEISYLYLMWDELDAQNLTFNQLDAKNLTFDTLERGEWIA